jgi:hypothetical protein
MQSSMKPFTSGKCRIFAAFGLMLLMLGAAKIALAADLDTSAYRPPIVSAIAPAHKKTSALANPWCRIVPGPKLDLFGDTQSFGPMAVCYSRGVLADSYAY